MTTRVAKNRKLVSIAATSINSEATLYTPTSGYTWRLLRGKLSMSAAGTATFKDNTGGTTILTQYFIANTPTDLELGKGILSGAANRVLTGQGINGSISGWIEVQEELTV